MYTLSGERTNITYYSDVRIPDAWRIGEVDGGWRVMVVSLQDEHSTGFGARIRLLEHTEAWAETDRRRPHRRPRRPRSPRPGPRPSWRSRRSCSGA